jgi:chromosome segregation ATPase
MGPKKIINKNNDIPSPSSTNTPFSVGLDISNAISAIQVEMKRISDSFMEFKQTLSTDLQRVTNLMDQFDSRLKVLENGKDQRMEMENRITYLEKKMDSYEREKNQNFLEFRGIPEQKDENGQELRNIITNISKITNSKLEMKDVEAAYRITPKKTSSQRKSSPRTVIVKLSNNFQKRQFLSDIKTYNKSCEHVVDKLNTSVIGIAGEIQPPMCPST